ncbi:helix-turn-helix domain-containing protein [Psychroflexus planctonicus]|uniref:Helix-turn-helix domain-containing protein n=1 Tax=Psychroflexus planctonicus TaxID=1526575 RepID=A0ABQ1SEL6_9FLAO|nr:helix-turn-helix domain-containing protein [Psychroflexus planctonicus]GGE27541.1 hypothetical protein GCM10010832_05300 [Psychroflexus planctonicus]
MENISFNDLPEKIGEILNYVQKLEEKIDRLGTVKDVKHHFDAQEAADFLGIKIKTLYNLKDKNEIAYCKPAKKLYFLKEDLMDYLKNSRCQSR